MVICISTTFTYSLLICKTSPITKGELSNTSIPTHNVIAELFECDAGIEPACPLTTNTLEDVVLRTLMYSSSILIYFFSVVEV